MVLCSTASRFTRPARRLLAAPTPATGRGDCRRMGGATRRDRSGNNAADAACQCDHRRRCRMRRSAGRGRDRKISRRPIFCFIAQRRRKNCASARRKQWDPILAWARDALGADFKMGEGIVHVAQPEAALESGRCRDPGRSVAAWRGACRDHADRLGADRARSAARTLIGRGGVAGGACRRRLEYGAVGQGRDGARTPRVPLR